MFHNGTIKTNQKQKKQMSNLHKDLTDAQIHVPKGFTAAANTTKLTKDASGSLVWAADSGGGGGTQAVAIHNKVYGSGFANSNSFCQESPSGNNEHKFVVDLGLAPTQISPKNTVKGSVYTITKAGEVPTHWSGHVYGSTGMIVTFELILVPWETCQSDAELKTFCQMGTSGGLTLSGNNTPICFNISSFTTCDPVPQLGDVVVLAVKCSGTLEGSTFAMEQTVRFEG